MILTLFFFTLMWLTLMASLLLFLPFPLFLLPGMKRLRKGYVHFWTSRWAGMVLRLSGSKVNVTGKEHIPSSVPFAIISNHQGNMDIPVLMSIFPFPLSFVAKSELLRVPIINLWLIALECIMIDRSKPRQSRGKIKSHLKRMGGNPVILFPEGTRSRGTVAGKWKKGGLRLLEDSGIPMVFVQIDGTYKIWEETGRIKPAEVMVRISPGPSDS